MLIESLLISVLFAPVPDLDQAAAAFADVEQACAAESSRLWGVTLCGPMLIADFDRGRLIANQQDPEGRLSAEGSVFLGELPHGHLRANTSVEWAGLRWTQVLAPLSDDWRDRQRLFLHESFHRIQPQIGLTGNDTSPAHLDEADGRLWQRLEWRALARALRSNGPDRSLAARHAGAFRAERHGRYPNSRSDEWALERNEGMAEYTGLRLAYGTDADARAARGLDRADQWQSLLRQFAYATGPAWGLLLDGWLPDWRQKVMSGDDLCELIDRALNLQPAVSVRELAKEYGLTAVETEERVAAVTRTEKRDSLERLLLIEQALVLPLENMQMSFDYRDLVRLPPHGVVYRTLTISDNWGRIQVEGAGLISTDFRLLTVPGADSKDPPSGPGWTLELAPGWRISKGKVQRTD